MKKKEPLSPKEENFCRFFVASREPLRVCCAGGLFRPSGANGDEAARRPEIKRRIAKLENERDAKLAEVTEGYRRLAFGSVADAVKLILSDELTDGSEIEKLDLTMVSDIKRPKGGGLEVKFFDRLKALDRLCELSNAASAGENSDFLSALDRSARALRGDDAGE